MLAGILLGLLESLYTAHLRVARFRRGWNDATDLILCLVGTLVVAAAIAVADWGQLRLWSVVGMALGFGIFVALGRPLVLLATSAIERALCRLVRTLGRPFAWIGRRAFNFARLQVKGRRPRV